jgi:hypothetical protein
VQPAQPSYNRSVARTYKATIRGTMADGTLVEPGLHYQTDLSPGGNEPDPTDVANDIWNQIGAPYKACSPGDLFIHELVVTEEVLPDTIGVSGVHTVDQSGLLPMGSRHLPMELVPIVLFHTQTRSRSARGHSFLAGPLNESFLTTDGVWENSYLGALQGFANACLLSFDLGTINVTHVNPVVYSRTRHRRLQTPYTFKLSGSTAKPAPTWLRSRASSP